MKFDASWGEVVGALHKPPRQRPVLLSDISHETLTCREALIARHLMDTPPGCTAVDLIPVLYPDDDEPELVLLQIRRTIMSLRRKLRPEICILTMGGGNIQVGRYVLFVIAPETMAPSPGLSGTAP